MYVFEAGQYSAPSHFPSRAIWYFSETNSTSPPLASRALREAFIFAKTSFILSRFCDVEAEIVTTAVGLEAMVADADLMITGEGRIDGQTIHGKTPIGVASVARRRGKPVIAIAGCLGADADAVYGYGIDAVFSVLSRSCSLSEAFAEAGDNLRVTARNVAATLRVGGFGR